MGAAQVVGHADAGAVLADLGQQPDVRTGPGRRHRLVGTLTPRTALAAGSENGFSRPRRAGYLQHDVFVHRADHQDRATATRPGGLTGGRIGDHVLSALVSA